MWRFWGFLDRQPSRGLPALLCTVCKMDWVPMSTLDFKLWLNQRRAYTTFKALCINSYYSGRCRTFAYHKKETSNLKLALCCRRVLSLQSWGPNEFAKAIVGRLSIAMSMLLALQEEIREFCPQLDCQERIYTLWMAELHAQGNPVTWRAACCKKCAKVWTHSI